MIPSPSHLKIFLSASISGSKLVSDSREKKIKSKLLLSYPCHLIIKRTRCNVTILSFFPKHTLGKASWDPIKTTQGNEKGAEPTSWNKQENKKPKPKSLPQITANLQTQTKALCTLPCLSHLAHCPSCCRGVDGTLSLSVTSEAFLVVDITV